jgi:hypothetical protein
VIHPNEPTLSVLVERRRELYAFKTDNDAESRENAKRIEAIEKQIARHKVAQEANNG